MRVPRDHKGDKEKLRRFERKILRRILGPVLNTETQWELKTNAQLENTYKEEDVVKFIKGIIMQWAEYSW